MSGPAPAPAPAPGGAHVPDPRRWRVLVVSLAAGFLVLLDVSIVNVALPSIRTGLAADESALQWVVSGYALAFGLLLVPAGRLGDAYGRRPALLGSLAVFTLASVACGLAPDAESLVVARLVQGAAGGVLLPQNSGLIQQLFRGAERGRAFGALGAVIGISTAVGPLLGGLLLAVTGPEHGWRAVFFVNLPVGIVTLLLAARLVPRTARRPGRQDLDPVGVVLLGAGVLCLLLPLIERRTPAALFGVAAVLLVAFVAWERRYARRGGVPMVDLALFRRRSYALGAGVGLLYFAGFTGVFFTYALYVQEGLHHSALASGLAVTPFAVGSAVTSFVGGRVVARAGRPLVAGGLVLVVVGLAGTWGAASAVPGDGVEWATALPLLVAGIGSGFVISPNQTLTLAEVPVERAGSAGGVLQVGQRIGAAAGIALTGSVFFGAVAATRGDFGLAFRSGLLVITAFVLLALLLAVLDVALGRRSGASA